MIPNKFLFPLIIIAVAIGYYFFSEVALAGLAGLFFGFKNKDKAARAEAAADEHELLGEYALGKAGEAIAEANEKHDESLELVEDVTIPQDPPKPGRKRKLFKPD